MLQKDELGFEHQAAIMPDVPPPEEVIFFFFPVMYMGKKN